MQPTESSVGPIGRRDAITLFAGLLAFAPGPVQAQAAIDRAALMDASALVTGMPADKLTGLVDAILAAFQDNADAIRQLAALARQAAPGDLARAVAGTPLQPVARDLAAAWYTGTVGAGPAAKLVSYEDAVAWKAAGYDSVPGMCAGEFGFWSEKPAGAA